MQKVPRRKGYALNPLDCAGPLADLQERLTLQACACERMSAGEGWLGHLNTTELLSCSTLMDCWHGIRNWRHVTACETTVLCCRNGYASSADAAIDTT